MFTGAKIEIFGTIKEALPQKGRAFEKLLAVDYL